jgi:hypothetical protein
MIYLAIYLTLLGVVLVFNYCAGTLNKRADEQMEEWYRNKG